jgi:heme/copper-type cytochrome/quinol oxidase subunit 2
VVKDITEQDTVNITAHNPYGNYSFTIELKYIDIDEEKREEIMWIVIVVLAVIIIIGIIVVYFKQKNSAKTQKSTKPVFKDGNQQSLLTVEN